MSEQTKAIFEATSSPMTVKNRRKDSIVLSFPTQSPGARLEVKMPRIAFILR